MHATEIDVNKQAQIRPATQFIVKYKCPAIVVTPELVASAIIDRGILHGRHQVICAVDWPKGTQYMSEKFRGMPADSLTADGYEILLTAMDPDAITREVKFLRSFFDMHFNQLVELRFVLGYYNQGRTQEQFDAMIGACKSIAAPAMVRTTHLTKLSSADGSAQSQQQIVDHIRKVRPMPIKISGSVNLQSRLGCKAERYACTLDQAIQLQKDLTDGGIKKVQREVSGDTKQPATDEQSTPPAEEK